jgi:hypothetical protein
LQGQSLSLQPVADDSTDDPVRPLVVGVRILLGQDDVEARAYGAPPHPATVVVKDGGNRLIEWDAPMGKGRAFVSELGKLIATLHNGAALPGTQQFVENVPVVVPMAPAKDTLIMFRPKEGDRWYLMFDHPMAREDAAATADHQARVCYFETALVTVPSGSKLVQSVAQPESKEMRDGLLETSIKYVRQVAQNNRPPNKIGCEGVAAMYERVCEAAEQVLWDRQARRTPARG